MVRNLAEYVPYWSKASPEEPEYVFEILEGEEIQRAKREEQIQDAEAVAMRRLERLAQGERARSRAKRIAAQKPRMTLEEVERLFWEKLEEICAEDHTHV